MKAITTQEQLIKAITFVQEHGWQEAKDLISVTIDDQWGDFEQELQNLLKSYELVQSLNGLAQARKEAHKNCFKYDVVLLKAISDVHLFETLNT